RSNSIHQYFYDKVEYLLCWATYYTACAMQYCYNEGIEKSNNEVLYTDYFVRNPVLPGPTSVRPEPDSQTIINKLLNLVPLDVRESVSRNLKNIGEFLWSIALAGISFVLKEAAKNLR
ncbi:unnamed protein product, partial [marine sediment metagenome]